MNMKKILLLLFVVSGTLIGQDGKWFPDGLLVQPFNANFLEPRLGFLIESRRNNLHLDIGSSMDVYRARINGKGEISFGADFFTYTFLRGEKDFHFPVDAVDYLFGLNMGYKVSGYKSEYGFRLRLSHISAHFVDGHYDGTNARWRDNKNPIVYSREFLELTNFYTVDDLRLYAGVTYTFHLDPNDLGKDSYEAGAEYFYSGFGGKLIYPFAAYDLRIVHLDDYYANHTLLLGIKLGSKDSRGFRVYFKYYKGKNIHGEYYSEDDEYSSFGFNLEF